MKTSETEKETYEKMIAEKCKNKGLFEVQRVIVNGNKHYRLTLIDGEQLFVNNPKNKYLIKIIKKEEKK